MPRVVLASASPQRRAILAQVGIAFEVRPSGAEEVSEGPAEDVALENARRKAAAVEATTPGSAVVVACDTVVDVDGALLGKPRDEGEARSFVRRLAAREHRVVSGLVVGADEAVKAARQVIGATNPLEAAPGSIRGDFALEVGQNMVHGSDSDESAEREAALFFGG